MKRTLLMSLGLALLAVPATAGPLTLSGARGSWSGAEAAPGYSPCVDYDNRAGSRTDSVRWGGGTLSTSYTNAQANFDGGSFVAGGDACMYYGSLVLTSGYDFDPFNGSKTFEGGSTKFVLGEFDHLNYPISEAVGSVSYNLAVNHDGGGSPLKLQLDFEHEETNNFCQGLGCSDDNVSVSFPALSALIHVGAHTYLFELLGFSNTGSSFLNNFTSPEYGTTSAKLWAQVTQQNPVPEPATMALLGTGLLGIGAAVRKRLRRRAADVA